MSSLNNLAIFSLVMSLLISICLLNRDTIFLVFFFLYRGEKKDETNSSYKKPSKYNGMKQKLSTRLLLVRSSFYGGCLVPPKSRCNYLSNVQIPLRWLFTGYLLFFSLQRTQEIYGQIVFCSTWLAAAEYSNRFYYCVIHIWVWRFFLSALNVLFLVVERHFYRNLKV